MSKELHPSDSSKTVIRGTGITSLLTLLSRILGFVRDLLVARAFGAGFFADAYVVAFRIPNLLRSLVGEGALTAAFVPVFSSELEKGKEAARNAIKFVSGFLLLITGVITLLGIGFSKTIVELFAPGFATDPSKLALCTELTQIMFPYIMCVSFIAMLNGALNTLHIFGTSAWAQIIMNLFLIAGALLAGLTGERDGVIILSASVIAGGIAQVVAQIPALRRSGLTILPRFNLRARVVKEVVILMLPATLGAAVYQTTIFINTVLASFLAAGSVSWLFYADRLTQLPIGIFTIALASVLLPILSRAQASNNQEQFQQNLSNSLRYTSFILIPICAGIHVFALPLIIVMFERGAFDSFSSHMTALAVQGLALGIWASSCQSMLSRAFIAKRDTMTPTLFGCLILILNIWFGLALMGPLVGEGGVMYTILSKLQNTLVPTVFQNNLHHAGLSLATSLSSCISLFIYALLAGKRFNSLSFWPFLRATAKSLIATIVMVLALRQFPLTLGVSFKDHLTNLFIAGLFGPLIYLGISVLLKSHESKETFALIRRLFKGNRSASMANGRTSSS